MIDTLQFFMHTDSIDKQDIFKNLKPYRSGKSRWWSLKADKGVDIEFKIKYNLLLIVVNPKKLLNKKEITNEDYLPLVNKLNGLLASYFRKIRIEDMGLGRIDYKIDINTPYIKTYIDILKKSKDNYRCKSKTIYETSVYYGGKSYNLNLYDKGAQAGTEEYKNVLRLEIQFKRRKLKDISKTTGMPLTLEEFFSEGLRKLYINKILEPILYKGDYYTINKSRHILKTHYTNGMTEKLISFQKLIFEHGITKAIELNGLSDNTIRSFIKKLENAGVNPFTIEKADEINTLPNLLSYMK